MCLSVPVKIISIEGSKAIGSLGGAEVKISLDLVEEVKEGDFVLVHTGMAIQKIDEAEARETFALLDQLRDQDEDTELNGTKSH